MFSTGFLTGALALLCLVVVIASIFKRKLSKVKNKAFDLKGVFLAFGFLPMAIMTLFSFRFQSAVLTNFFAYLRTPFLSFEFAIDAFAGFGQVSFVMDFFTVIIFGSTVAIALSSDVDSRLVPDHISGGANRNTAVFGEENLEKKGVSVPYLTYCRFLS